MEHQVTEKLIHEKRENWFLVAYSAVIASEILRHSHFMDFPLLNTTCTVVTVISCVIALLKLVLDLYEHLVSKKTILIAALGFAYLSFLFFRGQSDAIMLMWIFIVSSHDVSFDRLVKVAAKTMLITIIVVFASCAIGFINDTELSRVRLDVSRTRNGLGFYFFYQAAYYSLCAQIAWVYMRKNKLSCYEIISISVVQYYIFLQTDTRGPFILSCILTGISIVQKVCPVFKEYIRGSEAVGIVFTPICAGVVTWQGRLLEPTSSEFLRMLNKKLTNRLQLNYDGVQKYGLHFWGQSIDWSVDHGSTHGYNWIDSVYLYSLLSYGIPFLVGFFAIIASLAINSQKRRDIYMIIAIAIFALLGVWDNYCFRIECNPFMLFLSYGYTCGQEDRVKGRFIS